MGRSPTGKKSAPRDAISKVAQQRLSVLELARELGNVAEACRQIGVTEQTFYRWRNTYGGLRIDQVKRLKRLESDNGRLKRAVADLTLDNQILREAAEGNF